jgi:hypothetical protein
MEVEGVSFALHRYEYRDARHWNSFCGGAGQEGYWMEGEAILACLRRDGFRDLQIGFDHPNDPHGPSFAVAATR